MRNYFLPCFLLGLTGLALVISVSLMATYVGEVASYFPVLIYVFMGLAAVSYLKLTEDSKLAENSRFTKEERQAMQHYLERLRYEVVTEEGVDACKALEKLLEAPHTEGKHGKQSL